MSDWIEWKGGACPVQEGARIDVRHRSGEEVINTERGGCGAVRWFHLGMLGDIIAYRQHDPSTA